jgi:hypothetical protein
LLDDVSLNVAWQGDKAVWYAAQVDWIICIKINVEEKIKYSVRCDAADIADCHAFPPVLLWKSILRSRHE